MAFNLGIEDKYSLKLWYMLSHPTNFILQIIALSFKNNSAYCDLKRKNPNFLRVFWGVLEHNFQFLVAQNINSKENIYKDSRTIWPVWKKTKFIFHSFQRKVASKSWKCLNFQGSILADAEFFEPREFLDIFCQIWHGPAEPINEEDS